MAPVERQVGRVDYDAVQQGRQLSHVVLGPNSRGSCDHCAPVRASRT
jgi:hypothetical protein